MEKKKLTEQHWFFIMSVVVLICVGFWHSWSGIIIYIVGFFLGGIFMQYEYKDDLDKKGK